MTVRRSLVVLSLLFACRHKEEPSDTALVDTSDSVDADGDGVPASEDCDDSDANIGPGGDTRVMATTMTAMA